MSVRVSQAGAVLVITLDRPKANAIDVATSRALYDAFVRLRDDDSARVGIVTGAGERFFSAGWDLKADESVDADHGDGGFAGLTEFFALDKPVLAAVNGLALGGGFELALAADLIVVAEHAEFALPECRLGIVPDSGGVLRLPKRLPAAIANELLFTGDRLTAADAARWGLVNRVVPSGTEVDAAVELATRISESAPLAVAAIKEIGRATTGLSIEDGFARMRSGLPGYEKVLRSDDAREGPRAFAERRSPQWTGR
ncbi:enoyl-CoA hydratase-related protein [Amycolatopsis sp. OK19-0408]|uniref:enoyl-CoA hydratase n=1 Tax=Amycolatopsis iheyensis TaxID=2945988 RepID=A0A9X2N8M4_9PSEU|nr:enoyl-CoA hydratase-related protein [Amycolatopsis iheyensis]MCR6482390.1 enoyl-CoA hydratase-related protein [Amycolatopsis iheyensis]